MLAGRNGFVRQSFNGTELPGASADARLRRWGPGSGEPAEIGFAFLEEGA